MELPFKLCQSKIIFYNVWFVVVILKCYIRSHKIPIGLEIRKIACLTESLCKKMFDRPKKSILDDRIQVLGSSQWNTYPFLSQDLIKPVVSYRNQRYCQLPRYIKEKYITFIPHQSCPSVRNTVVNNTRKDSQTVQIDSQCTETYLGTALANFIKTWFEYIYG